MLNIQKSCDIELINSIIPFLNEKNEKNFKEYFIEYSNEAKKTIDILNNEFENYIELLKENLITEFEHFENDYKVVGTTELSKRKFSEKRKLKELTTQNKKFVKSKNNYQRYTSAIVDRIEYYEDLLWFSCMLIGNSYNIKKYIDPYIAKIITPIIDSIKSEIDSSISNIEKCETDINLVIGEENKQLSKTLNRKYIPSLINKVASNNVSKVLESYLTKLDQFLNEFDREYTFVNPKSLVYRLDQEQLKKFSPKEIISQIVLKELHTSINKISEDFSNRFGKLNSTIIGLERVVEFNLDSAIIKLSEKDAVKEEAVNIAIEGLQRASGRSDDYLNQLKMHLNEVEENVDKKIFEILEDLIALLNIERLITIKIQVQKEKAIRNAKNNLHSFYIKITDWFLWLKTSVVNLFSVSKEKLVGISSKVGLSSTSLTLSEAMADYLVRVSESLARLPYIYQRLFSNEQLFDERIFIGRRKEMSRLMKAVRYWQKNQVSSVMLIGEKGSGTSSLINIVLAKFDIDTRVYRKEFSGTIYTEKALVKELSSVLKLQSINSAEELITELNNFEEKIVVVIENIEDLFLKIVDGFEAIAKLLEIITSTNSKVLWITTCNSYSWNYLNKVLNINDYFIFNIELKGLDGKLVEEIILSRHNISGYELEFVPTDDEKKQKSYIKLSENEKHEYLREIYFEKLNKLTANNIAVALFLWLRSIISADEEKIKVSTNIELDFSFLKSLSDDKLFTLMAIILHDGISEEEHAKIFNKSLKSSQLLFATLADSGIIFKRNNIYKINFQLYKPILNLLKDKNILH